MSQTEYSQREGKMTLKVRLNVVESSRSLLNQLLAEVDDVAVSTDDNALKSFLRKLKDANNSFRANSIGLSSWYSKTASSSSMAEVNEERRHLYDEYRLAYRSINDRITQLGFPPGSSVGDASEYNADVTPKVNDWFDKNIGSSLGDPPNVSTLEQVSESIATDNMREIQFVPSDIGATAQIENNLVPITEFQNVLNVSSIQQNVIQPSHEATNFSGHNNDSYVSNASEIYHDFLNNTCTNANQSVRPKTSVGFQNSSSQNNDKISLDNLPVQSRVSLQNAIFHNDKNLNAFNPVQCDVVGQNSGNLNSNVIFSVSNHGRAGVIPKNSNYLNTNVTSHVQPSMQSNVYFSNVQNSHVGSPNFVTQPRKQHISLAPLNSTYPSVISSHRNPIIPPSFLNTPHAVYSEYRPTSDGQLFSSQGPRMSSCIEEQCGRAPLRNEAVREQLRIDLMKGNPHLTFDGSNPEGFWGWHDELIDKFSAAGFDPYPREIIRALRVHTDKRPKQVVTAYINAGLDDPAGALKEIWDTLKERYGSNDIVASCITRKLDKLKNIGHEDDEGAIEVIEDLHALCLLIRRLSSRCESLKHYSSPEGMKLLWRKMPESFKRKWKVFYSDQMERGLPITFDHLVDHINRFIRINSNPMFRKEPTKGRARTLRTEVETVSNVESRKSKTCSLHPESKSHYLTDCVAFKNYSYEKRREHAIKNRLCFNCLRKHFSSACNANVCCSKCSGSHITLMHSDKNSDKTPSDKSSDKTPSDKSSDKIPSDKTPKDSRFKKREKPEKNNSPIESNKEESHALRTSADRESNSSQGISTPKSSEEPNVFRTTPGDSKTRVCSKTLPVKIRSASGAQPLECLAIIDEQSSHTFIDERLVELLEVPEEDLYENNYTLTTLERLQTCIHGLKVNKLEVKATSGGNWIKLPPVLTHPGLPDTSSETAEPELVRKHKHIRKFANSFPRIDPSLEVLLLIGSNCGEAMLTRCYGASFPFVHKTALGYALVGPVCVEDQDSDSSSTVLRTSIANCEHFKTKEVLPRVSDVTSLSEDVFLERADDELPGCSQEAREFLRIVSSATRINEEHKVELPLPFKPKPEPPQNKTAVYRRASNTLSRIANHPETAEKCREIVQGYLERGHVRQLSTEEGRDAHTFIPVFLVKNESKGKLRLVFDSSAKFNGVSLNDCLYQGPDHTNRLTGVLMRFRHNTVAFSADIQTMFHCFAVPRNQEKFQCFYWFKDNVPGSQIVPYAATVHVFGHTSSPSIATYGLRYTTVETASQDQPGGQFIRRNFYVDDGLRSENTVEEAVKTLTEARSILGKFGIRLHKIISTHTEVLNSFPSSEIAEKLDHVDISNTPEQSALGIRWIVTKDELRLSCNVKNVEFTKRGILRGLGLLYDPLGIAAPVALTGRLLQRKLFQATSGGEVDWNAPLPEEYRDEWETWLTQLPEVSLLSLRRCYRPEGFGSPLYSELHVFCDASKESVGHVIYLRQFSDKLCPSVSFVCGSSRVSPKAATSIPRLELCAALYAIQSYQHVRNEIDLIFKRVCFYSDSKVVLGYLKNQTKRFSRYVTSRVGLILAASTIDQWHYVETEKNPADIATRPQTPRSLMKTTWFSGPDFLRDGDNPSPLTEEEEENNLPESLKEVSVLVSKVGPINPIFQHLLKFSDWNKLLKVTKLVFKAILLFRRKLVPEELPTIARTFLLRQTQTQGFPEVYAKLKKESPISGDHRLASLCPWLDQDGIMRVGGRLQQGDLCVVEKHPILLPSKHTVTNLVLSSCHEDAQHQGRLITSAAIRQSGYHIVNSGRVISSFIKDCFICKRFRGKLQSQQMSQLPSDRIDRIAPFEKCGMDVFGPYHLCNGYSTRKSSSTKKVWVLILTCLYSRGIHLELLTSLDTATFMLAFRRFVALRGNCTLLRSDNGTNFIGAKNQTENTIEENTLRKALEKKGCDWRFLPPKASHMAGVWERKIGAVKKVLNASMCLLKTRLLSRDEFSTLLQEAGSIVNHTPLSEVPCDPTEPFPVSPALLINLRESPSSFKEEFSEKDLLAYGQKRWRRVQFLSEQFFVRWKREYIQQQQHRNKWMHPSRNMTEGDIVLLKDSTCRNEWPMAIVEKVHPSRDGLVRRVLLRLRSDSSSKPQYRERAIHDLLLLIPNSSSPGECHGTA